VSSDYIIIARTFSTSRAAKMSALQVENLFAVQGKVVLVTGGSRGIGKMVGPKHLMVVKT
jgi:hypothetical protein